jgi:GMP synthase (glutamine-hydrolysing)
MIVLQHAPCETLGTIEDVLSSAGKGFRYIETYAGAPVPGSLESSAGLIVMGGPMGVYEQDRYPFLRDELRLIEDALKTGVPVLGICLGSQLLAAALGADVRKGHRKEIGWRPVFMEPATAQDALFHSLPSTFEAFHWHGDIFDLPSGAVRIAHSDVTECQAFRYAERVYGILFHMEVTLLTISGMIETFAAELLEESIDGSQLESESKDKIAPLQHIGSAVFNRFVGQIN